MSCAPWDTSAERDPALFLPLWAKDPPPPRHQGGPVCSRPIPSQPSIAMKRSFAWLAAPVLFAIVPAAPRETPRYAPAEDTILVKVFSQSTELELEQLSSVMDGQEIPPEFMPEIELFVGSERHVAVTDRIVSADGGRPLVLERTFDTITAKASESLRMEPGGESTARGAATSPLEGRTVRFTWNADDEEYEATYTDGEDGEHAPDELAEDMDLRAFLPPDEVEEGDEWELDAEVLSVLFVPGGDLEWEWELDEGMEGTYEDGDDREYDGTLRVLFAGFEQDGRLAVLELSGEVESFDEGPGDLEHIPVVSGTATISTTTYFDLEGRIWWDLAAGHLDALELVAALAMKSVTEKDPGQPGPEFMSTVLLSGTWTSEVSVQVP